MDYGEAVNAFFVTSPDTAAWPEVVVGGGPARRLRDACEPVAMHAVWSPVTNGRLAELGLDFLGAYVAGRAASLGQPVGPVVAAAFAWFEPGFIASVYDAAGAAVERDVLLAGRDEATVEGLRRVIGDDDDVTTVADLLADAVEPADGAGRPMFSGLRARGRPVDPVQRLWWACDLAREHRGDSHVAASAAAGLGPVEANILTELWIGMPLLSYTATRGWSPAAMQAGVAALEERGWISDGAISGAGRAVRAEVGRRTDAQERSIVVALGDRLDEVCGRLNAWGARCIEAGAFPPDILKRAAG
jgi:hypothetical protein